jgi:hypothetical protein
MKFEQIEQTLSKNTDKFEVIAIVKGAVTLFKDEGYYIA